MAAGGAFVPKFLAGAAVVHGLAQGDGLAQGLGVHVGEHERLTGGCIGGDTGDQTGCVELWCELCALLQVSDCGAVGKGDIGHEKNRLC
jgi:hypothetical protein